MPIVSRYLADVLLYWHIKGKLPPSSVSVYLCLRLAEYSHLLPRGIFYNSFLLNAANRILGANIDVFRAPKQETNPSAMEPNYEEASRSIAFGQNDINFNIDCTWVAQDACFALQAGEMIDAIRCLICLAYVIRQSRTHKDRAIVHSFLADATHWLFSQGALVKSARLKWELMIFRNCITRLTPTLLTTTRANNG